MNTVNDLFKFLNQQLGWKLPLLGQLGLTAFMVTLWKQLVTGWTPSQGVPSSVEIDVGKPAPLVLPVGGGQLKVTAASVLIRTGGGSPSSP